MPFLKSIQSSLAVGYDRPMEFIDLQTSHRRIAAGLRDRFERIMGSAQFIMGPDISELEEKLAHYVGSKHGITCSSGTDALLMAMMALGVG